MGKLQRRYVYGRISEGFPVGSTGQLMPAFNDQLTETERWHLVTFLRDEFGEIDPVLPEGTSSYWQRDALPELGQPVLHTPTRR